MPNGRESVPQLASEYSDKLKTPNACIRAFVKALIRGAESTPANLPSELGPAPDPSVEVDKGGYNQPAMELGNDAMKGPSSMVPRSLTCSRHEGGQQCMLGISGRGPRSGGHRSPCHPVKGPRSACALRQRPWRATARRRCPTQRGS
eukprot:scaffold262684_cov32-Tisochrysis_lutea.AAC.3